MGRGTAAAAAEAVVDAKAVMEARVEREADSQTNMVVAASAVATAVEAAKAVMEAVAEALEAMEVDTPGDSGHSRCSRCRESSTRTATQGRRRRRCGC